MRRSTKEEVEEENGTLKKEIATLPVPQRGWRAFPALQKEIGMLRTTEGM